MSAVPNLIEEVEHTLGTRTTGACTLRLLDDVQLVRQLLPFLGHPDRLTLRLIRGRNDARHVGRFDGTVEIEMLLVFRGSRFGFLRPTVRPETSAFNHDRQVLRVRWRGQVTAFELRV